MVGVVIPEKSAEITSRYEGRVSEISVRLGDPVEMGTSIAVLDVRFGGFDTAKAFAAMRVLSVDAQRAEAELEQIHDRASRLKRMSTEGVATGEELVTALNQEDTARLRLDVARALVSEKSVELDRLKAVATEATVRAPFAGVVSRRYLDPGANVGPTTPIVRLVGSGPRMVRFAAPQALAATVHASDEVTVAGRGGRGRATVRRIATELDGASRSFVAEADLAPTDGPPLFVDGETVDVTVIARVRPQESR